MVFIYIYIYIYIYIFLFPAFFSSFCLDSVNCLMSAFLDLLNKKQNGIPDFDRLCSISEAVYCTSYDWVVGAQVRRRGRQFGTLFTISLLSFEVWGVRN